MKIIIKQVHFNFYHRDILTQMLILLYKKHHMIRANTTQMRIQKIAAAVMVEAVRGKCLRVIILTCQLYQLKI